MCSWNDFASYCMTNDGAVRGTYEHVTPEYADYCLKEWQDAGGEFGVTYLTPLKHIITFLESQPDTTTPTDNS